MSDDEEEERRRRNAENSVRTLRTIANSETTRLDPSDCGELREVAMLVEDGARPSWYQRWRTCRLLDRFFFPA